MKKIILTALLAPLASFASITITADFTYALTNSGSAVPVGSKAVIVADTLGDGFTGSTGGSALLGETLAIGNFFGADDQILGVLDAYNPGTGTLPNLSNGYSGTVNFSLAGSLGVGDNLAIYFFPSVSSTSTTLTNGTFYGFFSQTGGFNADAGGSIAMKVPADGNVESLAYYTPQFYSDNGVAGSAFDPSQSQLTASLQIPPVPEPSTYAAVFGLVALAVAYRRRK